MLVETPEGRLLWDTSCPRDRQTRWEPTGLQDYSRYDQVTEQQYLDSRLQQLGVGLDEVDYVVLSHLHFDHAGDAAMFEGTNATMVVNAEEEEFAFGYEGAFNGAHLLSDCAGIDWQTVDGDTELLPGVTLIQAPGHTVGTMSMKVDLPETGSMIFTSDAWYASVEKIRGIAQQSNATVVFGHDAAQMQTLPTSPEGFYA